MGWRGMKGGGGMKMGGVSTNKEMLLSPKAGGTGTEKEDGT